MALTPLAFIIIIIIIIIGFLLTSICHPHAYIKNDKILGSIIYVKDKNAIKILAKSNSNSCHKMAYSSLL